jgi:hypothetical protein
MLPALAQTVEHRDGSGKIGIPDAIPGRSA